MALRKNGVGIWQMPLESPVDIPAVIETVTGGAEAIRKSVESKSEEGFNIKSGVKSKAPGGSVVNESF